VSLLWKVERYLKTTGVSPTRFGRDVAKDPRLVLDLRAGREVGSRLAARIDAWVAQQVVS
jgi:hypothetical protein